MTLNEFKKLKVNLPVYFVCFFEKDFSKIENKYSLSYHFYNRNNNKGIHVSFSKENNKISLWVSDYTKHARDWHKYIFHHRQKTKEEVENAIHEINFKKLF